MKKLRLLLPFYFLLSTFPCYAQDTLVYRTGEKVAVKVISVGGDVVMYSIPPGDQQKSVSKSALNYIRYQDGSRYSIQGASVYNISANEYKAPNHGWLTVNAGVGFSLIKVALPEYFDASSNNSNYFTFCSVSPAYNVTIDYGIVDALSIGVCGAYQTLTDNPSFDNTSDPFETERITRYNVAARITGHLAQGRNYDIYMGIRVGASIWTDQVISYSVPIMPTCYYQNGVETLSIPSYSTKTSAQLLFGYRVFIIPCLGFQFETGIGTPFLIEGGITFRFKTRNDKAK
jgi:hypothetical protein